MARLEQMSAVLLNGGYEDHVYGAVTFREADSAAGTFDFTVHVRGRVSDLGCEE